MSVETFKIQSKRFHYLSLLRSAHTLNVQSKIGYLSVYLNVSQFEAREYTLTSQFEGKILDRELRLFDVFDLMTFDDVAGFVRRNCTYF